MKKILLTLFVIATFGAYALSLRQRAVGTGSIGNTNSATITPPSTAGKYKNGTYTGSVADAFYGNIQVKVTIANGNISDVQFLQYPSDRSNSVRINTAAMPILKQEAIQVQTASVDIVSGATASSQAFQQSLGAALQQAA